MLEKPNLQDKKLIACLHDDFGLNVVHLAFLPLGADVNTTVYRAVTDDGTSYFVKLRKGAFDESSVRLPLFLSNLGIKPIIPPLATKTNQLWVTVNSFRLILYPFVEGHNGYEIDLADHHWRDLGTALKSIHTAAIPPALANHIQRETYSPQWRENVKRFLVQIETDVYNDPIAKDLAAFLKSKHNEILNLVERTDRLARKVAHRSAQLVLCHSDIHAGNVLIDSNDNLYVVDWDNPIFAPKERDLMYAGGGQFGAKRSPLEEERLFYKGYGQTQLDPIALAYYRYERIINDIAVECEQIFSTSKGGQDREQALVYFKSNFLPKNVLDIAMQSDKAI